jgi:hypothetical protein
MRDMLLSSLSALVVSAPDLAALKASLECIHEEGILTDLLKQVSSICHGKMDPCVKKQRLVELIPLVHGAHPCAAP